jgi:hypothetical protein
MFVEELSDVTVVLTTWQSHVVLVDWLFNCDSNPRKIGKHNRSGEFGLSQVESPTGLSEQVWEVFFYLLWLNCFYMEMLDGQASISKLKVPH